ncbi:hypothetical protein [Adhaeretor mobilis]|uniref:Uncharacterized protein n=1 Tax=Adhaeretor mobilis TaxID=1930276 RepID=A0A517N2C4_9BACT|nr:hypothetical protein [Adhaeretor mobilis]QDT01271.1 hypothetical protein HG15A2_46130 [Adhaeretor mobilis]
MNQEPKARQLELPFDNPPGNTSLEEPISEYVDSRGVRLRVDAAGGVLRGVKLIGRHSKNGREYRESTLRQAAALYEEAKVNVNHPAGGTLVPRDYRDRLGVIRDVQYVGAGTEQSGLFGDLHFNPKHPLAEQLVWDAQHNPRNVGFSHNVLARLTREDSQTVVEEITHVRSVDLVADPATTHGLFESQADPQEASDAASSVATGAANFDGLTLETLRLHRPDLCAEAERTLREQLDLAKSQATVASRDLKIHQLAQQHGLVASGSRSVEESLGERLFATLRAISEEELPALIAERAALLRRPRSVDQLSLLASDTTEVASAGEFAQAIKASSLVGNVR